MRLCFFFPDQIVSLQLNSIPLWSDIIASLTFAEASNFAKKISIHGVQEVTLVGSDIFSICSPVQEKIHNLMNFVRLLNQFLN